MENNFTFTKFLTRDWHILRMVSGLKGQARLQVKDCVIK